MRELSVWTLAIAMLTGGLVALAAGTGASPAGPVTNSDFELPPFPDELNEPLTDSAIDECIGIGHQVLYGEETPQGTTTGGTYDDPNPEEGSAEDAADQVAENPGDEAMFASGYGHCVWGEDTGYDLVWLHPKARTTQPAHWSTDIREKPVEFGYNFDDDPFDREAKILADSSKAGHNLWQWMGSKHQAFTPDADSLSMDIEAGDVSGTVKLILTNVGTNPDSTDYYQPCSLTFSQSQLADAMDADGHIEADPTEAVFTAREDSCEELKADWETGDEDERRDVLSQTRITQLSFWNWNSGTETDTVIDNVQLPGATTAVEAAAGVGGPLG